MSVSLDLAVREKNHFNYFADPDDNKWTAHWFNGQSDSIRFDAASGLSAGRNGANFDLLRVIVAVPGGLQARKSVVDLGAVQLPTSLKSQ